MYVLLNFMLCIDIRTIIKKKKNISFKLFPSLIVKNNFYKIYEIDKIIFDASI